MTEESAAPRRRASGTASGRRALGRGLDALLPVAPAEGVREIGIDRIEPNPHQPRQRFERAALDELAESIRLHGIIQPLVVTARGDDRFSLIVGERRWQAAKLAGLDRVPVVVKDATDRQTLELALIENVQRADLNALEEAAAYTRLIQDFGLTQQQVGEQVGKSRVAISNTVRLLSLPDTLKRALIETRISEGHARVLLQLQDTHLQLALLDRIEAEGWSVRQTEERVRRLIERPSPAPSRTHDPDIEAMERRMRNALGSKVTLRHGKRGGRIIIEYGTDEEFESLFERLVGESREL